MLDDQRPDQDGQTTSGSTSSEQGALSNSPEPPDRDAELAVLLCAALDGDDPVRISLLTRLALGMYADDSLAADLERMRRDGPDPVWVSNK